MSRDSFPLKVEIGCPNGSEESRFVKVFLKESFTCSRLTATGI